MRAFISYSHKDSTVLDRLHTHLAVLRREGTITEWYDREILAGGEVDREIASQLAACDLFLALVSPDFLASTYCYEQEMMEAIKRHDAETMRLVPIILDHCDWKATPLRRFKALPRDGLPISEWTNKNTAFLDIVTELRRVGTAAPPPSAFKNAPSGGKAEGRRYRVKRDFDEIDRSDFRNASYQTIRKYFESAAAEINGIEGLRARFHDLGSLGFTCTVMNQARQQRGISHITVHVGGRHGFGDIAFNHQENGPSTIANGIFSIKADEYDLFLQGTLSFAASDKEKLAAQQVAEQLWTDLLDRAGISVNG